MGTGEGNGAEYEQSTMIIENIKMKPIILHIKTKQQEGLHVTSASNLRMKYLCAKIPVGLNQNCNIKNWKGVCGSVCWALHKLGVVAHTCHPITWEVSSRKAEGQPIHGYRDPFSKQQTKN